MKLSLLCLGLIAAAQLAFGEIEPYQPQAQIVVIADKTQTYLWQQDMTLAQALMKGGGTSAGSVFLIRRGAMERLKITDSLDRKLEPWDILVVGYHPAPSPK